MRESAWLIDLDGTLYRALPVKLLMAVELVLGGWRSISVLRRFRHEHERLRQDPPPDGASPFAVQLERTAVATGVAAAEVERTVAAWMIRRPGKWLRLFRRRGLLTEIAAFREAGGKTALVSDYPAREKLRALGAEALFDTVVANGEAGGPPRLKPSPDGFRLAAERLGVAPEACLVVGDRDDADGEAARRAGMAFRLVPEP